MQFPDSQSYRSTLAVAFLTCLLWWVFLAYGAFEGLALPVQVKALIGLFTPLALATLLLYRTALFREMRRGRRFVNLVGVAVALCVCTGAILLTLALVLFALGVISPS